MSPIIAPWLEQKPSDFLHAAEAGVNAGLEKRGQDIGANEHAAALAQQAAESAQRYQEDQSRLQLAKQVADSRIALQTQSAARMYQQQRDRQSAIEGGMDPAMAYIMYPGSSADRPAPGMFQAYEQNQRLAQPPDVTMGPDGKPMFATYGGQLHMFPRQPAPKPDYQKEQAFWMGELKAAMGDISKIPGGNDPSMADLPNVKAAQDRVAKAQSMLEKFGMSINGPKEEQPTDPANFGPAPGTIEGGHKFVGGDPSVPENWAPIATDAFNPYGDQGASYIGEEGGENQAEIPGSATDENAGQ